MKATHDQYDHLTRAELIEKLHHRDNMVECLGKVLEDFSRLVIVCSKQIIDSKVVMDTVHNPWG